MIMAVNDIPDEIQLEISGKNLKYGDIINIKLPFFSPLCDFLHIYWSGKCYICGENAFIGHVPLKLEECDASFPLTIGDTVMLASAVDHKGKPNGYTGPILATIIDIINDNLELTDYIGEQSCISRREYWQITVPYSFHINKTCKFSEEFLSTSLLDFYLKINNKMVN